MRGINVNINGNTDNHSDYNSLLVLHTGELKLIFSKLLKTNDYNIFPIQMYKKLICSCHRMVNGQPRIIIYMYTVLRFSLKAVLVLEKKILCVLPYMGMGAIIFVPMTQRGSILIKLVKWQLKSSCLKS